MPRSTVKPANQPPSREDWDFRAAGRNGWYDVRKHGPFDFLDEAEVHPCICYEGDRFGLDVVPTIALRDRPVRRILETPPEVHPPKFKVKPLPPCPEWVEWKKQRTSWSKLTFEQKAGLRKRTFDALLDQYLELSSDKMVFAEWFYIPWPEWPDMPYLSIPRDERKRRREASWENNPPRTLKIVPMVDIFKDLENWKAGKQPTRMPYWGVLRELTTDGSVLVVRRRGNAAKMEAPIEIPAFEIDYNLSPKVLTRLFNNYVVQRRKLMGYKHRENRGPASGTERLRARLVALGARRLIDSGMTYKQAADYTKAVTGKPLYAHESEWSRACRSNDSL